MTRALLDLAELTVRAEVPSKRLRHYAEVGLLPPACRGGDQLGYPERRAPRHGRSCVPPGPLIARVADNRGLGVRPGRRGGAGGRRCRTWS
jgi:hypothetical protein